MFFLEKNKESRPIQALCSHDPLIYKDILSDRQLRLRSKRFGTDWDLSRPNWFFRLINTMQLTLIEEGKMDKIQRVAVDSGLLSWGLYEHMSIVSVYGTSWLRLQDVLVLKYVISSVYVCHSVTQWPRLGSKSRPPVISPHTKKSRPPVARMPGGGYGCKGSAFFRWIGIEYVLRGVCIQTLHKHNPTTWRLATSRCLCCKMQLHCWLHAHNWILGSYQILFELSFFPTVWP